MGLYRLCCRAVFGRQITRENAPWLPVVAISVMLEEGFRAQDNALAPAATRTEFSDVLSKFFGPNVNV
jgi:hypothetical protein